MTLLVPDVGERTLLGQMLRDTAEAQTLKLYSSDTTPAEGDTASTYTESVASGYSAFSLTRASWSAPATNAGTTSITNGTARVTTFTGSGTINGYFIVGTTSTLLLWAERLFTSPGQSFLSGDSLTVTPYIELA